MLIFNILDLFHNFYLQRYKTIRFFMEIHLKKQSLSGSFTTSGKARQLKSFCNLTKRECFIILCS